LVNVESETFRRQGLAYLKQNLPQERLSMAVTAVAAAEKALQITMEYCRGRKVFGQPVGSHQANRFTIAEMLAGSGGPPTDEERAEAQRLLSTHAA